MKFNASNTELLKCLQAIGGVISTKSTLPVLDCFLFSLKDKILKVTASDLETTLTATLNLENTDGEGVIAVPAKLLMETLSGFPSQPLFFEMDCDTLDIYIKSENGVFKMVGMLGDDFPQVQPIDGGNALQLTSDVLLKGINTVIYATATDELRPTMSGIFFDVNTDGLIFVASDGHRLVTYKRLDVCAETESSFILPRKPASVIKNILKKETGVVDVSFDSKNAFFVINDFTVTCRLVDGTYPNYNSVIPTVTQSMITINRLELKNVLKRVSVFSSQSSNLVKLDLQEDMATLSAQDIDFSISAKEKISCDYKGDNMSIGFKASFLLEIFNSLTSDDVQIRLNGSDKAGVFVPRENDSENEVILALLMPMLIDQ